MIGVCQKVTYVLNLNHLVDEVTHIGLHDRLYHITLKVKNEARLLTIKKITILVDTSDPIPGYIYDGPPSTDTNEMDFRTDQLADAHIRGAYDHESGIRLYRFAIADYCLPQEDFLKNASYFEDIGVVFINTTESFIADVPTGRSHWVVSAVVINNVMELSEVICSDGVTADPTPTVITEVLVRGASVKEGIGCFNGSAWIIWQNRTKQLIPEGYACDALCASTDMPELLAMRTVPGNLTARAEELCDIFGLYEEAGLSLSRDTLQMEWDFIEDGGQVNRFDVGVSRTAGNTAAPDLIGYLGSHSKFHIVMRHPAFGHGSIVFIQLKVENKAGLTAVETIGPVYIDETSPDTSGDPTVTVTTETVCLSWTVGPSGNVFDGESGIRGYDIAIGKPFAMFHAPLSASL